MTNTQSFIAGKSISGRVSAEAMLDVETVADLLSCSTRHVYRMADAGRMPRPLKLGRLIRWRRSAVESWIADGCPSVRRRGRRQIECGIADAGKGGGR